MRHCIRIITAALTVATLAGCSEKEPTGGQQVGSIHGGKAVPEGCFVATFTTPARPGTRAAEPDFNPITGPDDRVFDVRYLIYDESGNFVKEKLIFDDFDDDADNRQPWPLPAITEILPVGHYRAVFVTNTDADIFRDKGHPNELPDDLLMDYKLGFDQARLHLPYLLGADDPDFFMDVIEFSHEDPSQTVFLQRIVGVFKAYRSLVDVQAALDTLVADLVDTIAMEDILTTQVQNYLTNGFGGAVGGVLREVLGPLSILPINTVLNLLLGQLLDPLLNAILDPLVDVLYDNLLKALVHELGGILEGNDESGLGVLDLLDLLLNPWYHADNALITVTSQPTQFGFDMEVKARDDTPRTFLVPIADSETDEGVRRVVISKYLGFVDLDGDSDGEQLMTINRINTAIDGVVGGLILDDAVEDYLLPGALFDIEVPLDFYAPNNLQAYNQFSLLDLGIDDSVQSQDRNLEIGLEALDIANLNNALAGTVNGLLQGIKIENAIFSYGLDDLLGMVNSSVDTLTNRLLTQLIGGGLNPENGLSNLKLQVPISLPLLTLSDLNVSGAWEPENAIEEPAVVAP